MSKRLISSIVLILLLILAILIGNKAFVALAFLINAISLYEYINVIDKGKHHLEISKVLYIILGTLMLIFAAVNSKLIIPSIPIIMVLIAIINISNKKYHSQTTIYGVFGILYISLILSFMIMLLNKLNHTGLALIIFAILISVATDSFAFLFGIKFGKHKLCPPISPKKSVEGSIFGLIFGVLAGIILYFIYTNYNILDISLIDCIIMAIINSILCQFGDLTASMIKRTFDVKDYGKIIPGHGGVLDRIDGMLFSLAGTFFYVYIVLNMLTF
ncbi:phosphatidate cytidylyltransferase [Anaerofustis sp.]|uniref:phosphatidate cytidylyltransferase n=1 Tax=Anaerofustis sp. TaxID=1872517 RepID=UPI0025C5948A|nr:phosphatidate cytidylyltransferase [Anaerofustis sp.]